MDNTVVDIVRTLGDDLSLASIRVVLDRDDHGKVVPAGDEITLEANGRTARMRVGTVQSLFTGTSPTLDIGSEPPSRYVPFIDLIERTARECCDAVGRIPYDEDFLQIYTTLAKRPDGKGAGVFTSWIRAAARVGLALSEFTDGEYEGLMRRLARSARTFRAHTTSKNYYELALSRAGEFPA